MIDKLRIKCHTGRKINYQFTNVILTLTYVLFELLNKVSHNLTIIFLLNMYLSLSNKGTSLGQSIIKKKLPVL